MADAPLLGVELDGFEPEYIFGLEEHVTDRRRLFVYLERRTCQDDAFGNDSAGFNIQKRSSSNQFCCYKIRWRSEKVKRDELVSVLSYKFDVLHTVIPLARLSTILYLRASSYSRYRQTGADVICTGANTVAIDATPGFKNRSNLFALPSCLLPVCRVFAEKIGCTLYLLKPQCKTKGSLLLMISNSSSATGDGRMTEKLRTDILCSCCSSWNIGITRRGEYVSAERRLISIIAEPKFTWENKAWSLRTYKFTWYVGDMNGDTDTWCDTFFCNGTGRAVPRSAVIFKLENSAVVNGEILIWIPRRRSEALKAPISIFMWTYLECHLDNIGSKSPFET